MRKYFPFTIFHLPFHLNISKFSNQKIKWKVEDRRWKIQKGISLIEILVVVTIFAALGILIARSVILTLQGSQKSSGLVSVRENLDYSMGIIERQIRNSNSINCTGASPTSDQYRLYYTDQNNQLTYFSCENMNSGLRNAFVASEGGRLTNSAITITSCTFTCTDKTPSNQPYVDVMLTAEPATLTGAQKSSVTTNTTIYLRDY